MINLHDISVLYILVSFANIPYSKLHTNISVCIYIKSVDSTFTLGLNLYYLFFIINQIVGAL